jgi:serine/threonine protein kinase
MFTAGREGRKILHILRRRKPVEQRIIMETKMIGRYKLEDFLGEGAFAEVFKATDTMLKRVVALKLLKSSLLSDREAFNRFVQEAQAAAGLIHPHIAWAWDLGEADGRCYIAMRYVDGKSLDKVIKEKGALPWDEAVKITCDIGDALQTAHDRGLIHRDVKPQNIILSPVDGAVLTDFGLVKAVEATGSTTRTGAMIGTPQYMAPEIWEGKPAGPAADQFSLACVLVEMLSGNSPYEAPTPVAVMRKIFDGPKFPDRWDSSIPESFGKIIGQALAMQNGGRFSNMKCFIEVLSESRPPKISKVATVKKQEFTMTDKQESLLALEKGRKLYIEGNNLEAIIQLSNSIKLDPDNDFTYFLRGCCYIPMDNYELALKNFHLAISRNPKNIKYYSQRGFCYLQSGKYESALKDFQFVNNKEPENIENHYWRGLCYYKMKNYYPALEDFIFVDNNEPENIWNHYWRGNCYYDLEIFELAFKDFDFIVNKDPNNYTYRHLRGLCFYHLEKLEPALKDLDFAVAKDPENMYNRYWRGRCYYSLGIYEPALEDFDFAIDKNPNNDNFHYWRGRCYYGLGKYESALKDLDFAVEKDTGIEKYHNLRGLCHYQLGNHEPALKDFDLAINNDSDEWSFFSRGVCYFKIGEKEKALADLDRAIHIDDSNGEFFLYRAEIMRAMGRISEANNDSQIAKDLGY